MPSIETLEGSSDTPALKPDAQGDSGELSVQSVASKELEEDDDKTVETTPEVTSAESIHKVDGSNFVINFGAGKVGQILGKSIAQNSSVPERMAEIDDEIDIHLAAEVNLQRLDDINEIQGTENDIDASRMEEVDEPDILPPEIYSHKTGDGDNIYKHCDEDEEDLDETLAERLWGLTEMFPVSVRNASSGLVGLSVDTTKTLYSVARVVLWVAASSATILALPVMFETERTQMEEQQMQQQRQILLGPNAATAGAGGPGMGSMPMVVPPPPVR